MSEASDKRGTYRHTVATRIWHWITAITIFVMLGSGLMILNAHPHLYWGSYGANYDTPWISFSRFPGWMTIPSTYNLALARRWHLTFALLLGFALLFFMIVSLINRHFQRDLRIHGQEVTPRHLWADIRAHLAFRFHDPDRPASFNILQKLSYAGVIFVLLPVMIGTGLAMSPGMDAAWPWLLDLFGGRQSARSVHFIAASLIALFIIAHLALVILSGPIAQVRSMITGWWRAPEGSDR